MFREFICFCMEHVVTVLDEVSYNTVFSLTAHSFVLSSGRSRAKERHSH